MDGQIAREVTDQHREQGWRHVAGDAGPQSLESGGWTPDVDFHPGLVERSEETQAHDVVHVEVGEEDVHALESWL
jgi:hypothetical protein